MSRFVPTKLSVFLLLIAIHNASRLLLESTICPQDVKLCPSGLVLTREPNNCEFPPCICGGFDGCKSYSDGCNSCRCDNQWFDACTKKPCTTTNTPNCIECEDGYTLNPDTGHCEQILCTQEVKTCSDGTFVSKNPANNCEFDPCVGDSCGIPGIDCIALRCATALCPDGVTCYGCGCSTCSYEYDINGDLQCSGFSPRYRVCESATAPVPIYPVQDVIDPPSEESCGKEGKCYNIFAKQCDAVAPCPNREYCPLDATSPFFKICNAYPEALCEFSGCGGCYEYFVDDYTNVIGDCDADICLLPPEIGPCDAIVPRVFYDAMARKCVSFDYGGCGGNANNFATRAECNQICKRADKIHR